MVKIIDFQKRKNQAGEEFNILILQGGMEMIKSVKTGNYYGHARKASIPCTLDDASCKEVIGTKIQGIIERQPCEPYDFQIPDSEEVIQLDYSWKYNAEPSTVEEAVLDEMIA